MIAPLAALSSNGYWAIALTIGLVAALVVAFLLALLVRTVASIERNVDGLLRRRPPSPGTPPTSPSSRPPRPCSA